MIINNNKSNNITHNTLSLRSKFSEHLIDKIGEFMPNNSKITYNMSRLQDKFTNYFLNKIGKFEEYTSPPHLLKIIPPQLTHY
jgi:hypothetical protein